MPTVRASIKPSEAPTAVSLPLFLTVKELALRLGVPVTEVISILLKNGIVAHINKEIDLDTASIVAGELGVEVVEGESASLTSEVSPAETSEGARSAEGEHTLVPRPPVITVMGHVDHGKTSLLDRIRTTEVAKGEHGGITQHIGAYQVHLKFKGEERAITAIDTPGHEAFTAMRAHGANITDVVVLVVAADDGVKPQTIEAINHAKSAGVPIIVAINKIDTPGANVPRVKQELASQGELLVEEFGGSVPVVEVSAKDGTNIQELLETVLLLTDLKELTAPVDVPAAGVVVESHLEKGLGPLATVLVQQGELKVGSVIAAGTAWGRVKRLENDKLVTISSASPGTPVRVSGLKSVVPAGTAFASVTDEQEAARVATVPIGTDNRFTLADASKLIREGKLTTLRLVIKADTVGSLQAIHQVIGKLSNEEVGVKILHEGIGNISESEVLLAKASQAICVGFGVQVPLSVQKVAQQEGVAVSTFSIIYQLEDQLKEVIAGLLTPKEREVVIGRLKVLKIFPPSKKFQVVGGRVTEGNIKAGLAIRIEGQEVSGTVKSLRIGKEGITEATVGQECGLMVDLSSEIGEGMELVIFATNK
ncbi:translation initiation factor IF-2 [Candidatus Berkelbacteria bacterium]|nr:translation initiation factor IF-2 [Candidatus Berkelbacteria bacterium]